MKYFIFLASILILGSSIHAQDFDQDKMRYIEQFKYWAMDEQVRTGVPAAISLAQGILETGSGKSELCTEANNHFGIKCKKEWTGETYLHDDDRRHECFRKYKSAKDSYIDHSNFLATRSHYGFLFDLEMTDYKGWCNGLRKAGYATNPKYALRLIDIIEKYNLQQYSYEAIEIAKENNLAAEVVPTEDKKEEIKVVKVEPAQPKISQEAPKAIKRKIIFDKQIVKNGRPGFWARKGDYLLPEAVQYNIRYAKLLTINDLADEPLKQDMFIYLKRKAKKGDRMFHKVKSGETMHSISQNVGVQLKYLYIYNNLYDNEEPAVGEKIYLQSRSSRTPRLRGAETVTSDAVVIDHEEINRKAEELARRNEQKRLAEIEAKKQAIEDELRKSEAVAKRLEKEKAAAELAEQQKREAAAIARAKVKKEVAVINEKSAEVKKTVVKATKGQSPILNFEKAKRVEELMGDGSREVSKLEYQKIQAAKQAKVIHQPLTNDPKLSEIKKAKTATKQKKVKRKYDDKGVSDDVKDLKKKFDSLIYDD